MVSGKITILLPEIKAFFEWHKKIFCKFKLVEKNLQENGINLML